MFGALRLLNVRRSLWRNRRDGRNRYAALAQSRFNPPDVRSEFVNLLFKAFRPLLIHSRLLYQEMSGNEGRRLGEGISFLHCSPALDHS